INICSRTERYPRLGKTIQFQVQANVRSDELQVSNRGLSANRSRGSRLSNQAFFGANYQLSLVDLDPQGGKVLRRPYICVSDKFSYETTGWILVKLPG